jgi:hypothetical protein
LPNRSNRHKRTGGRVIIANHRVSC